jgi:putative DNA primase/helicase
MATAPTLHETLLSAALSYADRGLPVFPCHGDTKRPLTKNGFKDASTDPRTIGAWWSKWPTAMIGMPTGEASGVWVLDVDDVALFERECRIDLKETRRSGTGDGYHRYYGWDPSTPVRNAQVTRKGWPFPELPGCDVRGEGGYVILPPSRHPSGRLYHWLNEGPSQPAPAELLAIVRKETIRPDAPALALTAATDDDTAYGLAALRDECGAIKSAPGGAQEGTLNDAGLKIGALVAGGSLRMKTARSDLVAAGLQMTSANAADPWTTEQICSKIERALKDGTGTPRVPAEKRLAGPKTRALRLVSPETSDDGRPSTSSDDKPTIQIKAGALHLMATAAERVLISRGAPIYDRGGLVKPVLEQVPASKGRRTSVACLVPVEEDMLVDHLSRAADWVKFDGRRNDWTPADPPRAVASTILSRRGEWGFAGLAGVITTPTLRPDGTILDTVGYDEETQLLLMSSPPMPAIPDRPSKADAAEALTLLDGLLENFPFVDDASRSVALAALITPIVRGAMQAAPAVVARAPGPGTGKSYLIDLCSVLSTGEMAPVISPGRNEEEMEKRLGAVLQDGRVIIAIDNVNGPLGGDVLCQVIERPIVSVRVLGASKMPKIPNRACVFATGNNILIVGDMVRRIILCSLDAQMERPELRTFSTKPHEMILNDRGKYIAAALTIARAYVVAGFPDERPPLASFEEWSRFVRSPLVWLGRADPIVTMEKARGEDPVTSSLLGIFAAISDAGGTTARTSGALKSLAEETNTFGQRTNQALYDAIFEVAESRRGDIDPRRLGKFLGQYDGRIVGGYRLASTFDNHAKQKIWKVERV